MISLFLILNVLATDQDADFIGASLTIGIHMGDPSAKLDLLRKANDSVLQTLKSDFEGDNATASLVLEKVQQEIRKELSNRGKARTMWKLIQLHKAKPAFSHETIEIIKDFHHLRKDEPTN